MRRISAFQTIDESTWTDWRWQHRNRLSHPDQLDRILPNLSEQARKDFDHHCAHFRLAITPYALELITLDAESNPVSSDPIWMQLGAIAQDEHELQGNYDGIHLNWELPGEFPTCILHQKYPGRAILRVVDRCLGHCNYCYLAARVLDKTKRKSEPADAWQATLEHLRTHPDITEVLISGGDPLVLDNEHLDCILNELGSVSSIRFIRLNTRALTHNPFRFEPDLVEILTRHRIQAVEVQLAHPRELTAELDRRLALFDQSRHRPLFLWRAPLLRGVNDSIEVLEELMLGLYQRRIIPYYLFHYAPFSPGRASRGVPLREGVRLLTGLRRRLPGPAFPRYTLFHQTGKHDIPLSFNGTPEFRYETDAHSQPVVRFLNWKGQWVTYPDISRRNA